jgi:hypothetical protein
MKISNFTNPLALTIQLEFKRFRTILNRDYFYIFSGDSVYSPLIAALSGEQISSKDPSELADTDADQSDTGASFKLNIYNRTNIFLLFKSDVTLISSNLADSITNNNDFNKQQGVAIKYNFLTNCTMSNCTIGSRYQNKTTTHLNRIVKTINYETSDGDDDLNSSLRRAFHCSFEFRNYFYVIGGYSFLSSSSNFNFIERFDLIKLQWQTVKTFKNTPQNRHSHACALDNLNSRVFMYGGIKYSHNSNYNKSTEITNELWSLDLVTNFWDLLVQPTNDNEESSSNINKQYALPIAVTGHSIALINNNSSDPYLLIFFGFSEYYAATLDVIQEYKIGMKSVVFFFFLFNLKVQLTLD